MKSKKPKRRALPKAIYSAILGFIIWCIVLVSQSYIPAALPENGKPAEFYANQLNDDLRHVFLSGINDAKKSILLIIYTLSDKQIIQALKQKSEEGIDVQVICDAKGCPHIKSKLGSQVKVCKRISNGIMHQKILVVDGDKSWIGSANMTNESLRIHGNLVNAFHSQNIASTIREKANLMIDEENESIVPARFFKIGDQNIELWFLPDNQNAVNTLIKLINSAQKTIRVAMFTWTRHDIANAIIEADKRGVKVEMALDYQTSKGASEKIVKLFRRKGIPVRLSQGSALLHHKFLYIDDSILVNGSANWTKAAFTQNDDCFIILHNLTKHQRETMQNLWNVITADSR